MDNDLRKIVRTTWTLDLARSELREELLDQFAHAVETDTAEGVRVEVDTTTAQEIPDHLWSEKAECRVLYVEDLDQ